MSNNKMIKYDWNIFNSVVNFFFPEPMVKFQPVSGKITVCGKGKLEFELEEYPTETLVYFEDDVIYIPCNPSCEDRLKWKIIRKNSGFKLIIKWKVNNIRTIIWKLC